jgi:hypothetical protein
MLGWYGEYVWQFEDVVELGHHNIRWLSQAGSLNLPKVVLTPGMVGHFEGSVLEICQKN